MGGGGGEEMHHPYVVITPDYMVYTADFSKLIEQHIQSEADITLFYHAVDNAKDAYLNCNILNLNKQKGVLSIEPNHGNAKNRNIFMDTYIMKKDLFIELIRKAKAISSAFTLADIINELHDELDVRGVSHRGFFASITDFQSYYNANMDLIDIKAAQTLFDPEWPIYTRTNDSCPTHYYKTAQIRNSVVSNGCQVVFRIRFRCVRIGRIGCEGIGTAYPKRRFSPYCLVPVPFPHGQAVMDKFSCYLDHGGALPDQKSFFMQFCPLL